MDVIVIMVILLLISIYVIYNLYSMVTDLEHIIKQKDNNIQSVYNFILKAISLTYIEMQKVDKRGSFESDDEVGFAFRAIKELIEQLKFKIEQLNKDEQSNKDA